MLSCHSCAESGLSSSFPSVTVDPVPISSLCRHSRRRDRPHSKKTQMHRYRDSGLQSRKKAYTHAAKIYQSGQDILVM